MIDPNVARVANIGGGLLLVALGAWVAMRRPLRSENVAFGLFSAGLGLSPALLHLGLLIDGGLTDRFAIGFILALLATAIGLCLTITQAPARLGRADLRHVVVSSAFAIGFTAWLLSHHHYFPGPGRPALSNLWLQPVYVALWDTVYGIEWGALLFFALRYRDVALAATQRSAVGLMAAGLLLYPGLNGASQFTNDPAALALVQATCVAAVVVAAAWLWNCQHAPQPKTARDLAILTLLVPTLGVAGGAFVGYVQLGSAGVFGGVRIVTALVFAYAILKHQLLGIDVKVRWGISRSSVLAVFIAVFFVASEAAQQFFSDRLGSTYVGIFAAGTLVFAIAPLQRAAERFAEKAVPVAVDRPVGDTGSPSDLYRRALRLALADRLIHAEEEITLAELADRLGLSAKQAMQIRHEVERERGSREHALPQT